MTTRLFITLIIIIDLLFLSCYTKPKIDLSKIGNTYEISGTWIREGGFVSDYNGQSSAYKIVYTLLFSEDGTYRSSCDDSELLGRFEVKKDTVILINSIELISRYTYSLDGHELNFIKIDGEHITDCISKDKDRIEGKWRYK